MRITEATVYLTEAAVYLAVAALAVAVAAAVLVGWVTNIIKLVNLMGTVEPVVTALQALGIFLVPLGAVLGYVI